MVVFTVVLMLGAAYWFTRPDQSFRTEKDLSVATYLESANSIRGNTYRIDGHVSELLSWSEQQGRIIAFKLSEAGKDEFVPVYFPTDFAEINFQKGQRYEIKVVVVDAGYLKAIEIRKS